MTPKAEGATSGLQSARKQATLFGFFGKPQPGRAPSESQTAQRGALPASDATRRVQKPDTPPDSTRKAATSSGSSGTNSHERTPRRDSKARQDYTEQSASSPLSSSDSASPLRERQQAAAAGRVKANGTQGIDERMARMHEETTPPSSSPQWNDEGEDAHMSDAEEEAPTLGTRTRTRNASKRVVSYIESDDDEEGRNWPSAHAQRRKRAAIASSADEDSDDSDAYKPESPVIFKGKASGRGKMAAESDSDDSMDDFIAPDEDDLLAIEKDASKQRKSETGKKASSAPQRAAQSSRPQVASHLSASRKNFLASSSSASRPPTVKSGSGKLTPTEEPYEFLLHPLDENRNPPTHPDYDKRTLYIPPKTMATLTPFEKQFWAIKKKHFDTVLFFQKGKFYELYEDDALIAHREFGLKVTDRVKMKMAGVPESSFTIFANKFLALGYKVGRVDQSETAVGMGMRKGAGPTRPSPAEEENSKIVRRELKHIYTNGTIVDADCLPDDMSSYCVSIKEMVRNSISGDSLEDKNDESVSAVPTFGICFLDAATAEFKLRHIIDDVSRTQFETLLRSLRIKEVIHEKGGLSKTTLRILRNAVPQDCNITMLRPYVEFYDAEQTLRKLNLVFNQELANSDEALDIDSIDPVDPDILPEGIKQMLDKPEAVSALGGMLNYLTQLNLERDICASRNFDIFDPLARQECMIVDAQSLTHLNVLSNEQGDTEGTLISLLNRASTAFGKRLMKVWLLAPLARIDAIQDRQNAVEAIMGGDSFQEHFDTFAKSLPDIERIMPRIHAGNCKSRDFARVLKALAKMDEHVDSLAHVADQLDGSIVASLVRSIPSVSAEAQGIQSKYQDESFEPRRGCDEEYDAADHAVEDIERELQGELSKAATTLKLPRDKVKFKDVGTNEIYQVEVPIKTKVPLEWQLVSQTQSVKRYYPQQVRVLVKHLKEARETRIAALKTFQSRLFKEFHQHGDLFLKAVKGIAELDCLVSLAKASYAMGEPTCRPEFVDHQTASLDFEELRHPCLASSSLTEFIANDIRLNGQSHGQSDDARVTILTGGNMAGKSTTARTTATAVILAQLGCRVPASRAVISPVDRIASRMGANDQLFRNNSTFMVEMLEASRIIRDCTPRSLVIMDELGRGTSTFDGQAIAYAVLHYLIGRTRCLCFFLTHYTMLAHGFEGRHGVANKHMQVLVDSQRREVVFTYKLVPGIAESSYGTEVAELAGVPSSICERATLISREFAETMRETEEKRLQKLGDRLGVATLSDFSLIFRTGLNAAIAPTASNIDGEVADANSLPFLRAQISAVLAKHGNNASSMKVEKQTLAATDNKPNKRRAVYGRQLKPVLQFLQPSDAEPLEPAVLGDVIEETRGHQKPSPTARQMSLDFGQKVYVDCRQCGMSYDRRHEADRDQHAAYHLARSHGVPWPKSADGKSIIGTCYILPSAARHFDISAAIIDPLWKLRKREELDGRAHLLAFNIDQGKWASASPYDVKISEALAQLEELRDDALGAVPLHHFSTGRAEDQKDTRSPKKQLKMIVVVWRGRAVGSALIGLLNDERVWTYDDSNGKAHTTKDTCTFDPRSSDHLPADSKRLLLGVYRIHVVSAMRRGGIASALLDTALDNCIYGMRRRQVVEQHGSGKHAKIIAFSQPTQDGLALAESWLRKRDAVLAGKSSNLLVFDEQ